MVEADAHVRSKSATHSSKLKQRELLYPQGVSTDTLRHHARQARNIQSAHGRLVQSTPQLLGKSTLPKRTRPKPHGSRLVRHGGVHVQHVCCAARVCVCVRLHAVGCFGVAGREIGGFHGVFCCCFVSLFFLFWACGVVASGSSPSQVMRAHRAALLPTQGVTRSRGVPGPFLD